MAATIRTAATPRTRPAVPALEEIAEGKEPVVARDAPEPWARPERKDERTEPGRPVPPPGAQAIPVPEAGGTHRRPGPDVRREHRRKEQERGKPPAGDEEVARRAHDAADPQADARPVRPSRPASSVRCGFIAPRASAADRRPTAGPAARLRSATARTIASAVASAASAPSTTRSTGPSSVPVATAKAVSPSAGVCTGHNRAREAVVRHLRDLRGLRLRQPRIGRDDDERRVVAAVRCRREAPRADAAYATSASALAVLGPHAGDDLPRRRIDHVAERVDRRRARRRRGRSGMPDRRAADAAFHRPFQAPALPTVAPAPAPTLPSGTGRGARGRRRAIAAVGVGPDRGVAYAQVEQDGRRHNRHARHAARRSPSVLLEPAHHAGRRVEAERAAAGEHDRVDAVDRVHGIQQVRLARARRGAAHVDARDGARLRRGRPCSRSAARSSRRGRR